MGLGQEVAERLRGRPGVEPGVLLGRPDQDAAVVAGDQVILAVLDDPPEDRPVGLEHDDLTFERRRLDPDPQAGQDSRRPGAGGDDRQAARDRPGLGQDRRDPPGLRRKPQDRRTRAERDASPLERFRQRLEVPRVADLGAVGQVIRDPEVRD